VTKAKAPLRERTYKKKAQPPADPAPQEVRLEALSPGVAVHPMAVHLVDAATGEVLITGSIAAGQTLQTMQATGTVTLEGTAAGTSTARGDLSDTRPFIPTPLPMVPDAFPGGVGRLANNSLIFAGMQAIWKGGGKARTRAQGWRASSSGRPVYEHRTSKGGNIVVYPNLSRTAADPVPTTEMFWSFVESLSPFTGDVVLAVLAQLCEPSAGDQPKYPLLEPVRITTQAIARYKGIQRWGHERRLLDERIYEEMERIRGLTFDVKGVAMKNPADSKWNKDGFSWDGDQFFNVVRVEQYQESMFGHRERIEVSWSVRAGQWAYYWLNAQHRVYIGTMAKALLEMDHQGTALAKKLGQRVVLLSESLHTPSVKLRISNLLEDIGELPEQEQRSGNWAGRTRDRFDEAMLTLQESGVFAGVEWPDGHAVGDTDRVRGWARKWLAASVMIALPTAAPEMVQQVAGTRRRGGGRRHAIPSKEQRIDGGQIRQARLGYQWSQQTLAQKMGITVPYLSQLETGKRVPSKELASKLQAWLATT